MDFLADLVVGDADPDVEDPTIDALQTISDGLEVVEPEGDKNDSSEGVLFYCCALICSCVALCVVLLVLAGFCLKLWLRFHNLRPNRPNCSIEYFYVPALNKTLGSHLNTSINFMVRFDNPNKDKGIYYDDVFLSLSNLNTTTNSSTFVANYTVPHFYQGHKKKAKKWVQVLPLNNQTVLQAVSPIIGLAVFRLDLKTKVRFKILFLKTPRFKIQVGADVDVYGDGVKANKEGIKMKKSDSSFSLRSYFSVCVLMNLLVFFAMC